MQSRMMAYRVPVDVYQKLEAYAREDHRTVHGLVMHIIMLWLEHQENHIGTIHEN